MPRTVVAILQIVNNFCMVPTVRAGVDIGGTFTDLCIAGPDGIVAIGKALSTPAAPAQSVETVLRDALEREAYDLTRPRSSRTR